MISIPFLFALVSLADLVQSVSLLIEVTKAFESGHFKIYLKQRLLLRHCKMYFETQFKTGTD